MMEAVITGLVDEYKVLNKKKELFVLAACLLCFIPGITHVTQVRMLFSKYYTPSTAVTWYGINVGAHYSSLEFFAHSTPLQTS